MTKLRRLYDYIVAPLKQRVKENLIFVFLQVWSGIKYSGRGFLPCLGYTPTPDWCRSLFSVFLCKYCLTHGSIFYLPKNVISLNPLKGTLHIKLGCKDPTILAGEGRIRKRMIKQNRMVDNNRQLLRFQTTCKLMFIFCFIESRL